jgi:putative heme iron utilization protein
MTDPGSPFPPEVVAAVSRHMNDDHAADSLLICQALGGLPTATRARATGLDADGMDFAVTVDDIEIPARIPFGHRLTERAEIRREVVRMYRAACAQLGVEPRSAD